MGGSGTDGGSVSRPFLCTPVSISDADDDGATPPRHAPSEGPPSDFTEAFKVKRTPVKEARRRLLSSYRHGPEEAKLTQS